MLQAALICLAANIFYEARGETIPGQYAVAQVTMRRADWNEYRVCEVVYAKHQFSWTTKHKIRPQDTDPYAWWKAQRIAIMVLEGRATYDLTSGATHYHARYVNPKWSHTFPRTKRIGNHIFYKAKQA